MTTRSWGARAANKALEPIEIERRQPGPQDVQIEIAYCGVCHSDLHTVRSERAGTLFPCVPGHEIVGHVSAVGSEVTGFKVGDTVGVGCLVNSCQHCASCDEGLEQYCENGFTGTYNGPTKEAPGHTLGGYAQRIVVDRKFVLKIRHPETQLAAVAPLLCAGITTWSPLRHWKVGPNQKVGIVGLGGLGHMAVKFARAFGAHVVLFTTSPGKVADGLRLGAHEVVISKDAAAMRKHASSFDFVLDAVSAQHDINAYLDLVKLDGTLALVGAPEHPLPVAAFNLILPRRNFAGSAIGGIAETQEMLDFCGARQIVSDIELIPIQKINEAWDRLLKQDVKYRFVIDLASLKGD